MSVPAQVIIPYWPQSSWARGGLIIAIEPVPGNASLLKKNIKLNNARNIVVIEKAAWSCKSRLKMVMPRGRYALASAKVESVPHSSGLEVMEVPAFPLDELVEMYDVERVRLMKIDVEGAELEVLRGARRLLDITDHMAVEVVYDMRPVLELLKAEGFDYSSVKMPSCTLVLASRIHRHAQRER